jgi:hypothetical protein
LRAEQISLEEEKKKEMSENIQAAMKGDTSSRPSTSRQKQSTTNSLKPSTSTQKQLPASSAKLAISKPRRETKEESEPEKKKTGMLQKLRLAMMGRK